MYTPDIRYEIIPSLDDPLIWFFCGDEGNCKIYGPYFSQITALNGIGAPNEFGNYNCGDHWHSRFYKSWNEFMADPKCVGKWVLVTSYCNDFYSCVVSDNYAREILRKDAALLGRLNASYKVNLTIPVDMT